MNSKRSKFSGVFLLVMVLCFSIVVSACGTSGDAANSSQNAGTNKEQQSGKTEAVNLSMGTQPVGITFHTLGSAFAKMISENSSVNMTVKPFSGPGAWVPLMNSGDIDFGTDTYHSLAFGFKGEHEFDQNKNIRTLVVGSRSPMAGIIVREDSGIKSIKDLKGKRVASGFGGVVASKLMMEAHLKSAGLDWDDVIGVPVSDNLQGIQALREGKVDAAQAGNPAGGPFLELDSAVGIDGLNWADIPPEKFNEFPQEIKDEIDNLLPGVKPVVYEGGGFIDSEKMILVDFPFVVVVGAHVPDDVVYNVMETIWSGYGEWKGTLLESWTPELLSSDLNPPAPFHPAVVQFFKDKGVWNDEAEAMQQELMEAIK